MSLADLANAHLAVDGALLAHVFERASREPYRAAVSDRCRIVLG